MQAHFALTTAQQVGCSVIDGGKFGRSIPLPYSARVLSERDVEHPVQAIFNLPMAADILRHFLWAVYER